jgi:ATP-dependent Clp protease ATP-binding subunit ClpB
MDASNILKPALSRGELHLIGATTIDEYRKYIEKDPALERRFQTITIEETSVEDTISIIRGLKEKYEIHHGVRITDEAIKASVKLSDRYISGRFLPDKAIDVIDEASANLCIDLYSQPKQIDSLKKNIARLKIERKGLEKEGDEQRQIDEIDSILLKEQTELDNLEDHWKKEKKLINSIKTVRENIEELKKKQSEKERNGDLESAARIKYGELIASNNELHRIQEELTLLQSDIKLLKEDVEVEDVAEVISQWTKILYQD